MKKIIVILVVFSLSSCLNKKSEIVEQIKKANLELLIASGNNTELSIQKNREMDSLNSHGPQVKLLSEERWDYYRAEAAKNNDLVIYWNSVIDSLNMELKKY